MFLAEYNSTPFAIHSLSRFVSYIDQFYGMPVFRSENNQEFDKKTKETSKMEDEEILEHMPEWARILHQLSKKGKSGML